RVERVEVAGNAGVPTATLVQLLGLTRDDVFYDAKVDAGDDRIKLEYWRLGYYSVSLLPAYEELPASGAAEGRVLVKLAITEGPRGTIADIRISGVKQVAEAVVRAKLRSVPGGPYVQASVRADRDDVD